MAEFPLHPNAPEMVSIGAAQLGEMGARLVQLERDLQLANNASAAAHKRIAQLQQDNEQLRLSLQASAFLQERAKVERLTAENKRLRSVAECNCECTSKEYSDHNLSCAFYLKGKADRLTAENAWLREDAARLDWLLDGRSVVSFCSLGYRISSNQPWFETGRSAIDAARCAK